MTRELGSIRQEIDQIDKELVRLIEQRLDCVTEVIAYKIAHDLPIYDASRETAVKDKAAQLVTKKTYQATIVETFSDIMARSRDYQAQFVKDQKEKNG